MTPARFLPSLMPRTVIALILREMTTTYGRNVGGYVWAVLEPAAGIALMTAIFSVGFRAPPLGSSFPLFYATGVLPFLMFTDISGKLAHAILFSRALLGYPVVSFVDALAGRLILNALTQILVAVCVLGGILIFFDTRSHVDFAGLTAGFALAVLLAGGVGTMNCFLTSMFPVWQRIWGILMRPMFLVSCIFYTFETVPQPFRDGLWYNPVVHVVGLLRRAVYAGYDAAWVSPVYVAGVSLALLMFGLLFLRRYTQDILYG